MSRRHSKIIDRFKFYTDGGDKVEAVVSMLSANVGGVIHVSFKIAAKEIEFSKTGLDLTVLRADFIREAKSLTQIKWERWLWVTVGAHDPDPSPLEADIDVRVTRLLRTRIGTDEEKYAQADAEWKPAHRWVANTGIPETGFEERWNRDNPDPNGVLRALLPWSEETERSLVTVLLTIVDARKRIRAMMTPARIEGTLVRALTGGGSLLLPPAPKPRTPRPPR